MVEVIALACPATPNVANAIALNLNNLLTRPTTVGTETSEDDFTCPFANSDVTTNDCVVRFQITLKILFIKNKTPLHKFNYYKTMSLPQNAQAETNPHYLTHA